MRMPTNSEMKSLEFTVPELAGFLYPGVPISEELPPVWVSLLREYSFVPGPAIVWGYAAWPNGKPLALTAEGKMALDAVSAGEKRKFR
jgi:hypothetical protein